MPRLRIEDIEEPDKDCFPGYIAVSDVADATAMGGRRSYGCQAGRSSKATALSFSNISDRSRAGQRDRERRRQATSNGLGAPELGIHDRRCSAVRTVVTLRRQVASPITGLLPRPAGLPPSHA